MIFYGVHKKTLLSLVILFATAKLIDFKCSFDDEEQYLLLHLINVSSFVRVVKKKEARQENRFEQTFRAEKGLLNSAQPMGCACLHI